MENIDFYSLEEKYKEFMLSTRLKGNTECIAKTSGMAGDIYIFDQGEAVVASRYICVKVPKLKKGVSKEETASRFVQELKNQLDYYHNSFVNWAYHFDEVMGVPIALFRYWGSDLNKLMKTGTSSEVEKLSLIYYVCLGLNHCYANGLVCHQDLKPGNIFIRDLKLNLREPENLDVYKFAMVADFGLANAFRNYGNYDGTRPYVAPEQWSHEELSEKTDIFALGVILYEFLTNGFHPVGIKLADFWPAPKEGNTKKWVRSDEWKKWIKNGCCIIDQEQNLDSKYKDFIQTMLSISPEERPSLDEIKAFLLQQIEVLSNRDYDRLRAIEMHLGNELKSEPLSTYHLHLYNAWTKFEALFSKQ
ncbi:protein kinase [Pseudoalteromonas sp. MMG007]|uniref:protein kinase domain-containing protein n=1 Tax=Pseudoalteromonas sp. MMG007 TaxID=2822684 RepID=UPI001B3617DD|nr:protein kinase [Pseudoalteromonas sp. MMG007]MBQ4858834.1 protein kinase [Pseudoalteromonas sp. MMG007]